MRILVAAALLATVASPVRADAVVDAIRAEARSVGVYPFERTRTVSDTRSGGTRRVEVDRYDPARPEGQRWTLVSVNGKAPSDGDRKAHADFVAGQPIAPGPWRLDALLAGPDPKVARKGAETIYSWPKLPKGSLPIGKFDLTDKLAAEATVVDQGGKPTVTQVRIAAPEAFRVMMLAKIDSMKVTNDYARDERGRLILTRQETVQDATIPGRGKGVMRTEMTFRPL